MANENETLFNDGRDAAVMGVSEDDNEDKFDDRCIPQMKRISCPTWAILTAEMCERFSYYGIKAVLVLYLTQGLLMKHSSGKAWYHAFSMTSYFTGVVGAIIADSWLGKFRTIAYSLVLYTIAEILLSLTSVPSIGNGSAGPLFSLILMASACGNIKPCLGAFGGDQVNKKDVNLVATFFSMFYASVNVGATFTMIFAPMIRTDIRCLGGDCYPAVFGINTVIIALAFVSFMAGKNGYIRRKPEGNMIVRVSKIIFYALREKLKSKERAREHWLHYADVAYTKREIEDVRALLKVLVLFVPLPIFWALFHQQGSSWTLQAEQMDGRMGSTELRSDQIQGLNPVLVLILIPLYDVAIYPALEKCGIKLTSLKKMVCGMVLAALAFAITGFVQLKIQDVKAPPSLQHNSLMLNFINVSPCELLEFSSGSEMSLSLRYGQQSGYKALSKLNLLTVKGTNCYTKQDNYTSSLDVKLGNDSQIYQSIFFDINDNDVFEATVLQQNFPAVNLKDADSRVRTIYTAGGNLPPQVLLTYRHPLFEQRSKTINNFTAYDGNVRYIRASTYNVEIKEPGGSNLAVTMEGHVNLLTFGAYTVTLQRPMHTKFTSELVGHLHVDVTGTSVHRIWQLPQYIVLTAAEIMFSVTGLEFSYSQAPQSMKSVLQAFWMLTVAFGDFIVVLISVINPVKGLVEEIFLYGGAMLVVSIIFAVMCLFYTYNDFSGRNESGPETANGENEETNLTA